MLEELRKRRLDLGINAVDMAAALGLKTQGAYYKKETGAVKIDVSEGAIIAKMLKCSMDDLFFGYELSESDKIKQNPKAS